MCNQSKVMLPWVTSLLHVKLCKRTEICYCVTYTQSRTGSHHENKTLDLILYRLLIRLQAMRKIRTFFVKNLSESFHLKCIKGKTRQQNLLTTE